MLRLRRLAPVALVLAAWSSPAAARPQLSGGLTTGAALTDLRESVGPRLAYHLGLRADLLFGRGRSSDMAIGPYVDLATAAFDSIEPGGGVAWLVPAGSTAFVLSAGGFARGERDRGWSPGAAGTLFWGSRSYNFHGTYGLTVGLFAQGRYGLDPAIPQADAIVGVRVDLAYLALPVILAVEAIRR